MPKAAVAGIVSYGILSLLSLAGPVVNLVGMNLLARSLPLSGPGLSFMSAQGLVNLGFALIAAAASGVLIYGYFFADRKKAEGGK